MKLVTVESLGHQGDGVVRLADGVLHVAKVLPGEVIEIDGDKLARIVKASPQRVQPFCMHYDHCGGCKLQHWSQADYAAWKRQQIVTALADCGLDVVVDEMLDAHGAGRRRVSLHVRQQGGKWVAGFMEQKSHRLAALDLCPVLVPALALAPAIAADFGVPLGACDVALTATDTGLDVAIKAERKAVPRRMEALVALARQHRLARLSVNGDELVVMQQPVVSMGRARVSLPVQSFLQATGQGEDMLSQLVIAGVDKAKRVADLFCGVGPFALRLAEKAQVTAMDSDRAAIACLQQAVRGTQGLKPLRVETRDLFRAPMIAGELKEFDAVVFDPPRAGAEAQVREIAKSKVKKVVAVSCNAGTFARDAAILVKGGYRLGKVTPVDQFKYTSHVEIVAVFER